MNARMNPEKIEARLREVSRISDLSAEKRLDTKIDLSPEGIRARLLEVSELLEACYELAAARSSRDSEEPVLGK